MAIATEVWQERGQYEGIATCGECGRVVSAAGDYVCELIDRLEEGIRDEQD